jgi:hypothetical protein
MYSASIDEGKDNCHFAAAGRNLMTHSQAMQDYPDTSDVSLLKNNKLKCTVLKMLPLYMLHTVHRF